MRRSLKMRFKPVFGSALVLAALLAYVGCDAGGEEKFEKIPVAEIYSTSMQKGLQHVTLSDELPFKEQLENFTRTLPTASNIFLTRAKNLEEAIEAAIRFRGQSELEIPAAGEERRLWLIVFLGQSHSSPSKWTIDEVKFNQSKIILSYSVAKNVTQSTRDSFLYFALVPLKGMKAGAYELQLLDSGSNKVGLMRKVQLLRSGS